MVITSKQTKLENVASHNKNKTMKMQVVVKAELEFLETHGIIRELSGTEKDLLEMSMQTIFIRGMKAGVEDAREMMNKNVTENNPTETRYL